MAGRNDGNKRKQKDGREGVIGADIRDLLIQGSIRAANLFQMQVQQEMQDQVPGGFSSEDYIDATTVLGGIHKNIISKNFKGGDITIFMGGAEINLSQADIQGSASLDITQIMGGTKLIVPSNWEVRSQLTSVFGNIEDKRQNIGNTDPQKVLIIDGTSVFGGIEIRNY